jgi:PAS domain S-box-containing protein
MTPGRILIVEDERIVAEDLKTTLLFFGYEVVDIATRGETAVERARDLRPDLILMDIHLSGTMNGIQAAEQIRRFADIPVIYLTAFADAQLLESAKLTHPYGYILKPYAEREVEAAIEIALYTHGINRKLKESEERFRTLLYSMQLGIVVIDANTHKILDINPKGLEMIGGTRDAIVGSLCHKSICPAEQGRCPITDLNQTLDDSECILITSKGKQVRIQKSVISTILNGNQVLIESFIDLPERKRAEEALKESEQKCRNLIQLNTDSMLILNKENSIVFANFAAEQLFGRSFKELSGTPFGYDILTGELKEIKIPRLDGTVASGEIRISGISWENNPSRMVIIRDVTDRKVAEEALRESEAKFHDLLENADDLIQSVNPDGSYIYVNRTWCKTLGYTEEEIKNLTIFNIIHPDSQAHCLELFKRVINGETIDNIQAKFITKNGNVIEVEGNANCRFVDGRPVATRSIFRDITERRKMEQAIKDGEESFRGLFNTVKEAIYVMDVDGRFREVNQGALDMFGHTRTFLIGKSCEVLHAAGTFDIGQIINRLERAFKREPQNFEITGCRSNGELFPAECRLYRGLYFGKDVIIGLVIDITESKRAEKALLQANKQLNLLSSITRHDILNQLMALKGYLELSHDVINDPKTLIEYIKKEETAANAIEQQIIFTRNYQVLGVTAPVWQNVNESIKVALRGLPMRDIRVNVDPKDPEIFADPLFNKVFYNLIDNALRYGGADMKMIRISSEESLTGLTILFEDDGIGISTDDKKRIFIRGFGKNTGLGLFLSREILAITGITIIENGVPGKGARFEITVPKGMWRLAGRVYD